MNALQRWIRLMVQVELVLVFLVILAGSVVRMTGSGMGCPDWPKCFGHLIPPTEREQLEWKPNQAFSRGQIIIREEALWVAQSDFTSGAAYNPTNWEKYTKHDYALFNAFHTWTEYINRLLGALSGIPMLVLVVLTFMQIRQKPLWFGLALFGLFFLGFEAWLGKTVVDGNLVPNQITIHMLGAYAILATLLVLLQLTRPEPRTPWPIKLRFWAFLAVILTMVQVVLGTQVREEVDVLYKAMDGQGRAGWVDMLSSNFPIHRSFSIVVLLVNAYLLVQLKKLRLQRLWMPVIYFIVASVLIGMVLAYLGLPAAAQPIHLLLGTGLFALQFYQLIGSAGKLNQGVA